MRNKAALATLDDAYTHVDKVEDEARLGENTTVEQVETVGSTRALESAISGLPGLVHYVLVNEFIPFRSI